MATPPPEPLPRTDAEPEPPPGNWLTTDNWLGMTPPPRSRDEIAAARAERARPDQPTDRVRPIDPTNDPADQPTDAVEIVDDDIFVIDEAAGPSPTNIIAVSDFPEPAGDSMSLSKLIDIIDGPNSELFPPRADVIDDSADDTIDLGELVPPAAGGSAADVGMVPPSGAASPASGWLESGTRLPQIRPDSPSTADIGLPPVPAAGDEPSDIFSTARRAGGSSDVFGESSPADGGSDVLASVVKRLPTGPHDMYTGPAGPTPTPAGESDLFGGFPEPTDRGSSLFDDTARRTERVDFDAPPRPSLDNSGRVEFGHPGVDGTGSESVRVIEDSTLLPPVAGPPIDLSMDLFPEARAGSDDAGRPDFNQLDREQSGSNLFGDGTILDMELNAGAGDANILDPDLPDSGNLAGPRSSIFGRVERSDFGGGDDEGDAGRIDFEEIPLMGSSDDRTESMLFMDDPGPASGIFGHAAADAEPGAVSFDLPGRQPSPSGRMPYQDSAGIDWSAPAGADSGRTVGATAPPPSGDGGGDFDLNELAREDEHATARVKVDDESVFSAPDFDPDEYGIPPASSPVAAGARSRVGPKSAPVPVFPSSGRAAAPFAADDDSHANLRTAAGPKSGGLFKTAAGLLAGLAVGAGGMYALAPSSSPTTSTNPGTAALVKTPDAAPPPFAGASVAGDPAATLRALEGAGDDIGVKAARGQARWLARVRAVAAANEKVQPDDAELAKAEVELKSVVAAAPDLTTPEDQQAAMRSALNLGLIREAVGRPAEAEDVYRAAMAKMPAFKKVFATALQRVALMKKQADGTPVKEYSRLPAAAAADLTAAVMFLDFPAVQQLDDEPGFHFWEAINWSAQWNVPKAFDNAIAAIQKARAAHAARRQKLAGLGLNPLTDPTEQMFLRACDELKFYWTFKKTLYADPVVLALATDPGKRWGTGQILTDLIAAKKAGGGTANPKELADARAAAAKAEVEVVAAKKAAADATETAKKLAADAEALTQAAADAKAALAVATERDAAVSSYLTAVLDKLKDAKLIDPKADRAAAEKAIPDAVKKATLVSGTDGPLADLTARLAAAQVEAKTAKADAEKAAAAARDAVAAAAEKAKDFDGKLAAAAKDAAAKTDALIAKAAADRTTEAKAAEAKQAARDDQHRADLAAVRTGAAVQITDVEKVATEKATRGYAAGVEAYLGGRYADAEVVLTAAAKADPADARIWYFLGLAKFAQGRSSDADADFKTGGGWEARGKPGRRAVGAALERVQGPPRAALDAYRP